MLGHRARAAAGSLAVAAALALPIAGCGADATETYAKDYKKAAIEFKRSVDEASEKIPKAATLRDRIPALQAFKASIDRLAKELEGLDPPGNVAKLNDRAVAGLEKMSADLGRLEEAAASNDRRAAQELAPQLQVDQAELQAVLDQIDQKVKE